MNSDFHFDVGSQYATASVLCFVFGTAFLLLSRAFPNIRGIKRLALGFICAGTGLIVFLSRGPISFIPSVLLSNGLLWAGFLLFYSGTAMLLALRARLTVPASIAIAGLLCLAWLCRGPYNPAEPPHIVARIVSLSVVNALIIASLLSDVLRSTRRNNVTRGFSVFLCFVILMNIARVCAVVHYGAHGNIFFWDPVQISFGVANLVGICGVALASVALIGRKIADMLEHTARLDPLTSALNRRGIEELLAVELERSRRTRSAFSIALADIDHFKVFNDLGGHQAGDEVLQQVVEAIRANLRPFDACGRLGGDEFMLLLPSADAHDAEMICERILRAVAALAPVASDLPSPTLSIGFTQAHAPELSSAVIARADRALYAAKKDGRNRISVQMMSSLPATGSVFPA
jgi:diguanylate cyclase (GGDEF)-like protein